MFKDAEHRTVSARGILAISLDIEELTANCARVPDYGTATRPKHDTMSFSPPPKSIEEGAEPRILSKSL